MLFEELNKEVDTEETAVDFALKRNLLPEKRVTCPICNVGNVGWYKRSHEGLKIPFALRCSRKKCRKKWSVTKNTWFFGSHLSVKQNILLIYCWVKGETVGETSEILKISKSTVMDYYQFCREVCYTMVSNRTKPIGGDNEVVQLCDFQIDRFIDKQRRVVNFLEGVNHKTKDCFLVEIHLNSAETLILLLKTFILPNTTIVVDNWEGYSKIVDCLYEFDELNIRFVEDSSSPKPQMQRKCMWRTGKRFSEDEEAKSRDFLMFQYLYFHPIENLTIGDKFEMFLGDVAKVYPGPFKTSLTPVIY